MQENCLNNSYNQTYCPYPQTNASPSAVSINIMTPQAFASSPVCVPQNNGYYSMYGTNSQPNLPLYPQNYNNMINQQQPPLDNSRNMSGETNLLPKTGSGNADLAKEAEKPEKTKESKKDKKQKTITPLTDDYIKSLENYMNNDNAKVRLIGAKELMERFKEDENRKDNPSLIPLLNKALRDPSPSVRFLALTALQLGYSVGDDETVSILKEIQSQNGDHLSEDALLASEILLKLSAPEEIKVDDNKETDETDKEKENDNTI